MRYEATLAEEEALAELAELRNEYNDLDDEHDCLMEDIRNIRAAVENLIHSAENIATASGDSNIARFVHAHLDTLMENLKWGEYSKQIEEKEEEHKRLCELHGHLIDLDIIMSRSGPLEITHAELCGQRNDVMLFDEKTWKYFRKEAIDARIEMLGLLDELIERAKKEQSK